MNPSKITQPLVPYIWCRPIIDKIYNNEDHNDQSFSKQPSLAVQDIGGFEGSDRNKACVRENKEFARMADFLDW